MVLWLAVAVLLDRFVVLPHFPALSNILYLEKVELGAAPYKRTFDRFGLFVLLVVPYFTTALLIVPYLKFKRLSWKDALFSSGRSTLWFIAIPVIVGLLHILYKIADALLGDVKFLKVLFTFCEMVTFKCSIYVFGFRLVDLDASLAALVGAAVGILLFYRQGVWKVWSARDLKSAPKT